MATVIDVEQLEREVLSKKLGLDPAAAVLPYSYEQIKALLWIKDRRTPRVYRVALEEWEKKFKVFASSIERKTKQIESLKNEIYNLVGFYSVFQGVVFTAVAQGNDRFTCGKSFIPIVLSILASVVSFVGVLQKHQNVEKLEVKLKDDLCFKQELERREIKLRSDCENFRFANLSTPKREEMREKATKGMYFGAAALLVFSVFLPFSYGWILCWH